MSTLDPNPVVHKDLISELWNWETKAPVPRSLFQMFECQSQLFLLVVGLKKAAWIDHSCFLTLWQHSLEWGVENLFVEILARRQVNLSDPYSAFIVIGDFGARILLYYASLESQWLLRSKYPINAERREVSGKEYSVQVCSQFYAQPLENLQ